MIDLYDAEIVKIRDLSYKLVSKFSSRPNTPVVLEELRVEATGRFAELGFLVSVDTSPCLLGQPPLITVEGRIAPHTFDHEIKKWEVEKAHQVGDYRRPYGEEKIDA